MITGNSPINRMLHFVRDNLNVFGLSVLVWTVYTVLFTKGNHAPKVVLTLFVGSASLLTVSLLHLTDYFDRVRILPRKSDLLQVALVMPFSGLLHYGILQTFGKKTPFTLTSLWLAPPIITAIIFGAHAALEWHSARNGRRKKVVLDVLPQEIPELAAVFQGMGYDGCVDFLSTADLKQALLQQKEHSIHQIIISRGAVRDFHEDAYLVRAHLAGIPIVDRRKVIADLSGRIKMTENDSWSFILTATRQTPLLRTYAQAKLFIEPVIAIILAVFLAPVICMVAVAIRLTSSGPVFYRQARTGYLGRTFSLIKFRSMRTDSEASGPQWCVQSDSRITPVGNFIRRTRLDELPQLWNVIRGEMSFFGPRPERPEFYPILKEGIPLFSMRTIIRPGVTGWAQVCSGYAASMEESKVKLEHDLYYIKHVSLRFDLVILLRTFRVAFYGSERARTMPVIDLSSSNASVVAAQPVSLES